LDRGVHTFAATYLAENRPVATLWGATSGSTVAVANAPKRVSGTARKPVLIS
jgi:hypothetical protein